MSITLPPELESLVKQRLASGRFESEQEVIREALQLLESRESLLAAIKTGDRQYQEGRYHEYDIEGLRAYRSQLLARVAQRNRDNLVS